MGGGSSRIWNVLTGFFKKKERDREREREREILYGVF